VYIYIYVYYITYMKIFVKRVSKNNIFIWSPYYFQSSQRMIFVAPRVSWYYEEEGAAVPTFLLKIIVSITNYFLIRSLV